VNVQYGSQPYQQPQTPPSPTANAQPDSQSYQRPQMTPIGQGGPQPDYRQPGVNQYSPQQNPTQKGQTPKTTSGGKTGFLDVYYMLGSFAVAGINLYYFIRSPWWLNIVLIIISVAYGIYELLKIIKK
jgi:hypothetical protein